MCALARTSVCIGSIYAVSEMRILCHLLFRNIRPWSCYNWQTIQIQGRFKCRSQFTAPVYHNAQYLSTHVSHKLPRLTRAQQLQSVSFSMKLGFVVGLHQIVEARLYAQFPSLCAFGEPHCAICFPGVSRSDSCSRTPD